MKWFTLSLTFILASISWANPLIVYHHTYISSEKVTILVGKEYSLVEARFTFKSVPNDHYNKYFDLTSEAEVSPLLYYPLYLPKPGYGGNKALELWGQIESFNLNWINPNSIRGDEGNIQRDTFNKVIGLSFAIEGQEDGFEPIDTFGVLDGSEEERGIEIYKPQREAVVLFFKSYFDRSAVEEHKTVIIKHKLYPIRNENGESAIYLPLFKDRPDDIDESNYSIKFIADEGILLSKNPADPFWVQDDASDSKQVKEIELTPKDRELIQVYIHKEG